jgi:hypothetical protein
MTSTHTHKGPEAIALRAFMFDRDLPGQSIWCKTANATKEGHGGRLIQECVGDELSSIAFGAATKEILREAEFRGPKSVNQFVCKAL